MRVPSSNYCRCFLKRVGQQRRQGGLPGDCAEGVSCVRGRNLEQTKPTREHAQRDNGPIYLEDTYRAVRTLGTLEVLEIVTG
jgi:hypothetical protein